MKFTIGHLKYTEDDSGRPWPKFPSRKIYGMISVGDDVKKTESFDGSGGSESLISFECPDSSMVKIQVYEEHSIRRDRFFGGVERTLESFRASADAGVGGGTVNTKLYKQNSNGSLQECKRSISFTIHAVPGIETEANDSLDNKVGPTLQAGIEAPTVGPVVTQLGEYIADAEKAYEMLELAPWQALLSKVERFNGLMTQIADVHPYSKAAWGILSAASKFMIDQAGRDDSIKELLKVLNDVYDFLAEAQQLEAIAKLVHKTERSRFDVQINILVLLAQQTNECAHFICAYATDTNYWKRTLKHSVSEVDQKIKEYQATFNKLKADFQDHAVLRTQVTVLQIKFITLSTHDKLDSIAMDIVVDKIPHALGARHNSDKGCLPNTRLGIIDEIVDWANLPANTSVSRIFWLTGVAGSGKSAIAHTVAQRFQAMRRLGSSFCFDVASQAVRGPQHLFSTISWDLGNFDLLWKQELWGVIKDTPSLQSSLSVTEQFESFLLSPAKMLKMAGPVVIVIDALDESGDPAVRKPLLSILCKRIMELPPNFRVLITSRPEPDILEALQGQEHVYCKHMETIDELSTKNDISQFIQAELAGKKAALDEKWPDNGWCKLLVDRSEGLFQWAFTACLFIKEDFYTPVERLETLVELSGQTRNLDVLYFRILEQKISASDQNKINRFVSIMRTVLTVKEPLPMSALHRICLGKTANSVRSVLQPLGALLSGVTSESSPIQTLHTSFRDFLMDKDRSGCFHVEIVTEHHNIVSACLEVMKGLKFNICQLDTSCERNKDVAGLNARIQQHIPSYLQYACQFWADHLKRTGFDDTIGAELKQFLNTRLLYWLEVLSFTKSVKLAVPSLETLAMWIKGSDSETAALAIDGQQFVATFWPVIKKSVPHIYLSALPFLPSRSMLAKYYLDKFANILSVKAGKAQNWPGVKKVLGEHKDCVNSLAFSPIGNTIVSGSDDHTIRIWDSRTGQTVVEPMKEHTDSVNSVAISANGKYIASGSSDKTIRIWDTETGNQVAGPFENTEVIWTVTFSPTEDNIAFGLDQDIVIQNFKTGVIVGTLKGSTDEVQCIAFSPDGKYIASGSCDDARIWKTETNQLVGHAFTAHNDSINCIAFSPDGKVIASGGADWRIFVWDIQTGAVIVGPIDQHSDGILSIAYSLDGKRVIAGSSDNCVSVWDVERNYALAGFLEGHTDAVSCVAYSPDGRSIASSSDDKTIRIWDAEVGDIVVGDFEGHTTPINAVAFLPNGKHIISGADDCTIRLWDSETGIPVGQPMIGHTDAIRGLAVSSDGKHVVSAAADYTIRVWSIETGSTIAGPFTGHTDWVNGVDLSTDGTTIVSISSDETVRVWDARSGNVNLVLDCGGSGETVSFSSDGKRIIAGLDDNIIRIWDIETGNELDKYEGHSDAINSVTVSHNNKKIASGSRDETVMVWDVETGKAIGGPLTGHIDAVNIVRFSPDGKYLASGSSDGTIQLWDVEAGYTDTGLFVGPDSIICIDFSPDGNKMVSGSVNKSIRVWNISELELSTNNIQSQSLDKQSQVLQGGFSLYKGWVLGPEDELLFWVPPWNYNMVYSLDNTLLIAKNHTILDYSNFVYGTAWKECYTSTL